MAAPVQRRVTVTKGGVLFAGTDEGEIKAYNAANGAELWHFEIGAGPSMASVYEYGWKGARVDLRWR